MLIYSSEGIKDAKMRLTPSAGREALPEPAVRVTVGIWNSMPGWATLLN